MKKENMGGRCYIAAFITVMVAFAFYVFEAGVMLVNSADVNIFSEFLILSVVIWVAAVAFAVFSVTLFKSKRRMKILFLISAAVLTFLASLCAVYGYGTKGGNEWAIKHNVNGFSFDVLVSLVAELADLLALIVVLPVSTAEVRAERRVIRKQKRAAKKADLEIVRARRIAEAEERKRLKEEERSRLLEKKRVDAEKIENERKIAADKRAEEKRITELKKADEKAEREREKMAKKSVAAEASSVFVTDFTPIEPTNEDAGATEKEPAASKRERKLKVYPFVFAGVSLILTLTFVFMRWSGDETVNKVKFFLFSAICYQWVLLGIHIIRNVKGGLKYLGILVMALAPVSYAMLAVKNTDETRFFVNVIACFLPYNGINIMFAYLIDTIFGSISAYNTWEYFAAGMAISMWLGTLVYFIVPSKSRLSGVFGRDGWVRYFVCALMTAFFGLVLIVLVVALAFVIIGKLVGLSSSSSSYYSGSSEAGEVSECGESAEEDDRFNKTLVLGDLRDVSINGDTVTDLNSGREYRIYNYHSNTGYFEDENRNVYYRSSNGEVIVTGEYRGYSENEYEADNRIHEKVGFTR